MRTIGVTLMFVVVATAAVACKKPADGAAPAGSASATSASASMSAAAATAAATTAAPSAAPAKPAFEQKGIPSGKVVVGYIQDDKDPNQCAAVVDAPAKKDSFKKDGDKLAAMVKGKIVDSCPTDDVIGTCNEGFGMLVNYSGPKWAADTAKKDCAKEHGKWVE